MLQINCLMLFWNRCTIITILILRVHQKEGSQYLIIFSVNLITYCEINWDF
jgi:hypothetical protein